MSALKSVEAIAKRCLALVAAALLWRPWRGRHLAAALAAPKRILLVRIDERIGEALLTTAMLSTLKRHRPIPQVDVLVHPRVLRVLAGHPELDHLVPFERYLLPLGPLAPSIRSLRRARYDVIFNCGNWSTPSVTSAVVARLAGPRSAIVGPRTWPTSWLHSVSVSPRTDTVEEVAQRVHLLSVLPGHSPSERISFRKPRPREEFRPFTAELVGTEYGVLYPGGRLDWRRIPPEIFRCAAQALSDLRIRPIVAWGPGEKQIATLVADKVEGARLAPETDLDDLAALIQSSQLCICNNTGPMHLAVAVGTPTLGLFYRMDSARWGHSYPPHRMIDLTGVLERGAEALERVRGEVESFAIRLRSQRGQS